MSLLKKIFKFIIPDPIEGCNGSCDQGRIPCDCGKYGAQYYCFESCKEKCREKKWCGTEPPEKNLEFNSLKK
jgi:hypothetical protein